MSVFMNLRIHTNNKSDLGMQTKEGWEMKCSFKLGEKKGEYMKKIIGIKNRMRGIRCLAASVIVLLLAVAARVRKENCPYPQQAVPVSSECFGSTRKFVSVQVMQGDTLWSIAEDYRTGNYTTKALVEEIKWTNGLGGDKIMAGSYLIVPYYD